MKGKTYYMSSKTEEYNRYFSTDKWKGYAPMVERLIFKYLEPYKKATVLDLGCGVGNNLWYLSQVWKDSTFTGVDISDVAISVASAKVPKARLILDSIANLKATKKYNIIFLIGVLEHMEDVTGTLAKVKSLSNGVVFVRTVFNEGRPREFSRPGFGDNQAEWNFTQSEWEELFYANGFEVVERVTGLGLARGRDLAWIIRKVPNAKKA
jgi:2-polyprenyl-3-methyl-5-hydroxy-6-metoxy-1,4-benzoquinol methylase